MKKLVIFVIFCLVIKPLIAQPIAGFDASLTSGCPPLLVKFTNSSINATLFTWYIDNQIVTKDKDLTHNFINQGNFKVKLLASDGVNQSFREVSIQVLEIPKIIFFVKPDSVFLPNQPIRCFNLTENAVKYVWTFGEFVNDSSSLDSPVYYYKTQGKFYVSLTAWSKDGCKQQKISDTPIVVESEGEVIFPNAFTPSLFGATGGEITPISSRILNDIFHPISRGVNEFHLKIYTLSGLQLFESNSEFIGWDGYYQGRLCNLGTYIYHFQGRTKNGGIIKQNCAFMLIR